MKDPKEEILRMFASEIGLLLATVDSVVDLTEEQMKKIIERFNNDGNLVDIASVEHKGAGGMMVEFAKKSTKMSLKSSNKQQYDA